MRPVTYIAAVTLGISAALLAVSAARSQPACASVQAIVDAGKTSPHVESVAVATPAEVKIVAGLIEAAGPPAEFNPQVGSVVLVTMADGYGFVLFGPEGAICYRMVVPPSSWPAFLRTVRGTDS